MASREVELCYSEQLWLLDHISIFSLCPPDEQLNLRAMENLKLKLLSSLIEAKDNRANGVLTLEEMELWMALETVQSSAQMGSERVGMNLIYKLGKALLEVRSDFGVGEAVDQIGEGGDEEPTWDKFRLKSWKEAKDANPNDYRAGYDIPD